MRADRPGLRFRGLSLGLGLLVAFSCSGQAADWSPDGRWLAFALDESPGAGRLDPAWLLGAPTPAPTGMGQPGERRWRIWATQVESGQSVLLAESTGPLSGPAWSPDGTTLAYARWVDDPKQGARVEVQLQNGPDRRRVLASLPVQAPPSGRRDFGERSVCWSPDGRSLAVPVPGDQLRVLRVETGATIASMGEIAAVAWAPDSQRLAYHRTGPDPGLVLWDARTQQSRRLAESLATDRLPAPIWSRDGRAVWHLSPTPVRAAKSPSQPRRGPVPGRPMADESRYQVRLLRTNVASGEIESLLALQHDRIAALEHLQALALALDAESDELFSAIAVEGEPVVLTWAHPRGGDTVKRFHPIHESVAIRGITLGPAGPARRLALQVAGPGRPVLPALCDPRTEAIEPIAPSVTSRSAWSALLLDAVANAAEGKSSGVEAGSAVLGRPTRLPLPGEFDTDHPTTIRLRRLGRLGRGLDALPPTSDSDLLEPPSGLAEARLVFDCLLDDHRTVLDRLEAEPDLIPAASPDSRLRRLGFLAQEHLALGEDERAAPMIAFLVSARSGEQQVVEETAQGPRLETIEGEGDWTAALKLRLDELRQRRTRGAPTATGIGIDGAEADDAADLGPGDDAMPRLEPIDPPVIPRPPVPGLPNLAPGPAPPG